MGADVKRKLKFFLVPFVLALFAFGAAGIFLKDKTGEFIHPLLIPPAWYGKLDKNKPLEEQTADIKIGTRTLRIPLMYIDSDLKSSREDESVVLEFFLPDFKATPQFANREEYKEAFNERRKSWLLLEASEKRPSFEIAVENHRRGYQSEEKEAQTFGLEKYTMTRRYKMEGKNENAIDEFYFLKNSEGQIIDFIHCDNINSMPFPGCRHRFREKGLLYDLSFNKKNFLHNWQERKKKVTDLIEKMSLDTPQPQTME